MTAPPPVERKTEPGSRMRGGGSTNAPVGRLVAFQSLILAAVILFGGGIVAIGFESYTAGILVVALAATMIAAAVRIAGRGGAGRRTGADLEILGWILIGIPLTLGLAEGATSFATARHPWQEIL